MDLLDEIESETLYLALVTVDRRTLQIVLLKMQGYSTKEMREAWNLYRKNLLLPAQGGPLETRLKNSDTFQQQMNPTVWGLRMVCSLPLKEKSVQKVLFWMFRI